jgi:hypothetical protein
MEQNRMKVISLFCISFIVLAVSLSGFGQTASLNEDYLTWSAEQAESIAKQSRNNGKVGNSFFDLRGLHQDKAINYKLRATLMSPEMIRASARFEQLRNRLTDAETRKLVSDAEAAGDLIVMVELDPNEGSGVIPLEWRAFLQPKDSRVGAEGAITGTKSPEFRKMKALAGVARRDYNYDVFWVSFSLVGETRNPLIAKDVSEIELIVGIYGKEGKVSWRLPESVRAKMGTLSHK